jgi:hypothetical protein
MTDLSPNRGAESPFSGKTTTELLDQLHGVESVLELDDETIQRCFDVEGRPYYERRGRALQAELQRRLGTGEHS